MVAWLSHLFEQLEGEWSNKVEEEETFYVSIGDHFVPDLEQPMLQLKCSHERKHHVCDEWCVYQKVKPQAALVHETEFVWNYCCSVKKQKNDEGIPDSFPDIVWKNDPLQILVKAGKIVVLLALKGHCWNVNFLHLSQTGKKLSVFWSHPLIKQDRSSLYFVKQHIPEIFYPLNLHFFIKLI